VALQRASHLCVAVRSAWISGALASYSSPARHLVLFRTRHAVLACDLTEQVAILLTDRPRVASVRFQPLDARSMSLTPGRLCSRRRPPRPLDEIGSRYPGKQSPRSAFAHCEGSVEGDHGAAQSRIWLDDGSGRFGGARCVRCRAGRRLAFRDCYRAGSRRGATPTPTRPPHTPAARRSR
jgi:hypothetical protein